MLLLTRLHHLLGNNRKIRIKKQDIRLIMRKLERRQKSLMLRVQKMLCLKRDELVNKK